MGAQKPGLTRGKAVLIGVLSIVLVVVLYVQFGRQIGESTEVEGEASAVRAPAGKLPITAKVVPAQPKPELENDTQMALLEFDQATWKPPELSKVIAYDPFARPAGFPQPAPLAGLTMADDETTTAEERSKQLADALAELRMQLDELKERGVHVIVGQKDQYVAMIGDRRVQVGDEINGFTVTKIDPKEGVRVEWKSSQ
jgi:hypothetical protein